MTHAEHIAFAEALAKSLGPLGVKRVKIGGVELEFHEPTPAMVDATGGRPSPEDQQAIQMESESSTDPLDDAATFNGRPPPSYGRRPKKAQKDWPELDTEGQE
jgi:hypothetical protein